jgi:hypothetical protein
VIDHILFIVLFRYSLVTRELWPGVSNMNGSQLRGKSERANMEQVRVVSLCVNDFVLIGLFCRCVVIWVDQLRMLKACYKSAMKHC